MLYRSLWLLFKVETPCGVRGARSVAARRPRQFTGGTAGAKSAGGSSPRSSLPSFSCIPPLGDQGSGRQIPHSHENLYGNQPSQRQRYRQWRQEEEERVGRGDVAGAFLSPIPRKYSFYDGIDEHGVEAVKPSVEARRQMLQRALESQAASGIEFTEGGEADIELNGLPESEFHGKDGWMTVPSESALYNGVHARSELDSRQRANSWSAARRQSGHATTSASASADGTSALMGEFASPREETEAGPTILDAARRRQHNDGGTYSHLLEGELLEPVMESVGQPRSTYGMRKMFVNGLVGYQGVVTRAEEAQMCDELLQLLQDHRAAYIAEETRYCVNLYESELGIPGKDTLAFAISRAPTLQRVLFRFFFLGLIPSPPNVCQVSEMIGNFSGYPVHRKPQSIGPYFGLLNLVSPTIMHMQHRDCPWYPRLHISPRSLFIVSEPCLGEYALGYKQTHQPFHTFEYATRVSKDYRIEVLFATVETEHTKHLSEAVQLTEYATQRLADGKGGASSVGSAHSRIDEWIEKARQQLHDTEGRAPVDGHALRRSLLEQQLVASKGKKFADSDRNDTPIFDHAETTGAASSPSRGRQASAAQRRLSALKARHELAMQLKRKQDAVVRRNGGGPQLIRGHSPNDKPRF